MKSFRGLVVSLKNKNTAVVKVETLRSHEKYKKIIKLTKKFQVHYDQSKIKLNIDQKVVIKPSRPFSATKRFIISDFEENKN